MNIYGIIKLFIIAVLLSIIRIQCGVAVGACDAMINHRGTRQGYDTKAYPFKTEEARCDFVIMLDTSGSMRKNGLFRQVTQSLAKFISVQQPGDYLSILAFDSHPRYLVIPQEVGEDTYKLKQAILQLPEPTGQKTDIGAALERTISELNRPHNSNIQFVFFITDGKHEPPENSKYPTLTHANWELLRQKASRTLFDHSIQVTGLGLNQHTDISLLRKVFPEAVPLTVDEKGLMSFFARLKAELKTRKLRLQVLDELKKGKIEIVPESLCKGRLKAGGTASFQFKLKSDYEHLNTAVRIIDVKIFGDDYLKCSVEQMGQVFNLKPKGESPMLTLHLMDNRRNRRLSLRKVERKKVQVEFNLAITLEPQECFLKLNINPELKTENGKRKTEKPKASEAEAEGCEARSNHAPLRALRSNHEQSEAITSEREAIRKMEMSLLNSAFRIPKGEEWR